MGSMLTMEGSMANTTNPTSTTITRAQIVTTSVIGSLLLGLVLLNLVMYSIYKKLTKDPKVSAKINKQQGIQLYQVKSTGQYNSLSHSSLNQSQGRINTIRTISLSGDDITSVEYSTVDITQSYNPNKSIDSFTGQDASYQLNTSKDAQTLQQREFNQSKAPNQHPDETTSISTEADVAKATSALVETEAEVHKDSLTRSNKSQGLSDIHLYQCYKAQFHHKRTRKSSKLDNKAIKHPGGITREAPLEIHSSRSKVHQKIKGYVDMTDFDNDTDTEVNVLQSLDSVQSHPVASDFLDSSVGVLGRPVVEFQNKAFEFSETKTALEEVADTDL